MSSNHFDNLQELGSIDIESYLKDLPPNFIDGIPPLLHEAPPIDIDTGEQVEQTGCSVETSEYPGNYNFRVIIEESSSKFYTFSDKQNRLYCNLDKAVPVRLLWDGPTILNVRALLMFPEPDDIYKPVHRCRAHNDEALPNNHECKHRQHVVRCENENSLYKENKQSSRLSVLTSFCKNPESDGVRGVYKFMCSTTCAGPGAIARRKTILVLTLEDNGLVVGRAVLGIKICSCPVRDRKKDEEDDGSGKKKRRNQDLGAEAKKGKREDCAIPNDYGVEIKQEIVTDGVAGECVDLQIDVPNFPANKVEELKCVLRRIVASFFASDEDFAAVSGNIQIHQSF